MFNPLSDLPQPAQYFAAFIIVLALIGLTFWILRRLSANRLGAATRGRQPRLAVIDAANVDGRRRLVLIRRDNVEHLMMIGGPNDVVVEPNIVRAAAVRDTGREFAREPARAEPAPRPVPVAENGGAWPLQPISEPAPAAPVASRPLRGNVPEEPWVASEPAPRETPRPRPDSISGMASEFSNKLSEFDFNAARQTPAAPPPPPVAAMPPPPPPAAAPEPAAPPQSDRNLAEMAQRLEAALRRPNSTDYQPPVTDPLAAPAAPKAEAKVEPKFEARPAAKPEAKPGAKNPFDSLEQEMANLLGRQPGKS